jgi:uncharacterized protein YjbI with pentapeptide repeats
VKKRNEKKHWRNMFLERFLNVKDWAKKTTQYLLRRTYQNKFLPFKAWANKRILPRINISILFVAVATVSLILLEKIHSLKKLIWVLGTVFLFFFAFHFNEIILEFSNDPKPFFTKISFKDVAIAIAAAITLGLTYWRSTLSASRERNFSKQIENQTRAEQNQQFLDAVDIFDKSKTLEAKKGALFHLENLALSSPAHRQRVLDFLNSLNSWMREKREEIKDADFTAWKNEKNLLIDEKIVPKETQLLSAEIPKIFENIIRKHNEEYKSFSEEEKKRFALDFSYFVFAEIHFVRFDFPQTITSFRNCIFLGNTNFSQSEIFWRKCEFFRAKFSGGNAIFPERNFLEEMRFFTKRNFLEEMRIFPTKFSGGSAIFYEAKFSGGNANFYEAKFSGGNADFSRSGIFLEEMRFFPKRNFLEEMRFFRSGIFWRKADFRGAQFSGGNANFYGADFLEDADFSGAFFWRKCDFFRSEIFWRKCGIFWGRNFIKTVFLGNAIFTDSGIFWSKCEFFRS